MTPAEPQRTKPAPLLPFAERTTLERAAGRLPHQPNPLLGRDEEVAAILALLRGGARLLTLTGPGGIGKTRLALAVATAIERDREVRDGVRFVSLAALTDPDLVAPAIAEALGVREQVGLGSAEALAAFLRGLQALLVVDNCEQVLSAMLLLSDLLSACLGLQILATSRARLRLAAERTFPVPPLAVPAAVESTTRIPIDNLHDHAAVALFVERAQAVDPRFRLTETNAPAVVEIVRRLDGLPLAIELAAPRIAVLSPAALLARVERRLSLLTRGPLDAPFRQQTLRSAIAWSYDLLTLEEQTLFCYLAVFAGGFTLETAEAVCEPPDPQLPTSASVLDALTTLVENSLVVRERVEDGEPRFRILETLREFALERLQTAGQTDDARSRQATYCVEFARLNAPVFARSEATGWATKIAPDVDNLRLAVDWTLANGLVDETERLIAVLARFWARRGQLRDGRAWLDGAARSAAHAAPALRARLVFRAGAAALFLGDYAVAEDRLLAALALEREAGDQTRQAHVLHHLAACTEYQGDEATAVARYEEALGLANALEDRSLIANLLSCLADASYRQADWATALVKDEEALGVARAVGDAIGTLQALTGIAQAASVLGDLGRALGCLDEAIRLADDAAYLIGVADALVGFAAVAIANGDSTRAACLLGAAAEVQQRTEFRVLPHHAQQQRTEAHVRKSLGPEAFEVAYSAGRALSLSRAIAKAQELVPPAAEATRLLDGVEDRAPVGATGDSLSPAGHVELTRREVEILRLLVAGHSDRKSADMLSISPRTVETHVANIVRKFGLPSRIALVAYAVRHNLV